MWGIDSALEAYAVFGVINQINPFDSVSQAFLLLHFQLYFQTATKNCSSFFGRFFPVSSGKPNLPAVPDSAIYGDCCFYWRGCRGHPEAFQIPIFMSWIIKYYAASQMCILFCKTQKCTAFRSWYGSPGNAEGVLGGTDVHLSLQHEIDLKKNPHWYLFFQLLAFLFTEEKHMDWCSLHSIDFNI